MSREGKDAWVRGPGLLLGAGLLALSLLVMGGVRWWGGLREAREGRRAIEIVQLRLPTNLTASALNVDALSYDWLARRRAPGVYEVKHVYVFDRIWRYDRWENDCWLVTLAPETSRRVPCGAMGWDRSQSPRHQGHQRR
jgi:hypothetical protein